MEAGNMREKALRLTSKEGRIQAGSLGPLYPEYRWSAKQHYQPRDASGTAISADELEEGHRGLRFHKDGRT